MLKKTTEHANIWRARSVGGVELMRARYVTHSFSRHFHEGYCLGIIEDGALGFRYRGAELVAPAGSVNLCIPGEVHDGHGADATGWAYRMFYMEADALRAVADQVMPRVRSLPHFKAGVIHDPALAAAIGALHRDMESGVLSAMEEQTRFLALLTGWISRHAEVHPEGGTAASEHRAVRMAREIIEDRFAEDLSLETLAQAAALSPFHLVRTFAERYGMPPHAYLTQVRVNRAAALLSGRESLSEVAAATGFADQAHLTRWFKRYRGFTPGKYRKIVQDA